MIVRYCFILFIVKVLSAEDSIEPYDDSVILEGKNIL